LRVGRGRYADFGVIGAVAHVVTAAAGKLEERVAQEGGVAVVERLQRSDGLDRIGEALPLIRLRRDDGGDGCREDSMFHDPL
jgi:hypothetical protein